VLVQAVKADLKPRDIVTKQGDRERGGGDHGHRRQHERGAALPGHRVTPPKSNGRSTTSSACASKTPVLCDLKPSGRFLAIDLHHAGGIPAVMKMLLEARPAARRLHDDHRQDRGRGT
jgi:dihydroxy-acid dehydratase